MIEELQQRMQLIAEEIKKSVQQTSILEGRLHECHHWLGEMIKKNSEVKPNKEESNEQTNNEEQEQAS